MIKSCRLSALLMALPVLTAAAPFASLGTPFPPARPAAPQVAAAAKAALSEELGGFPARFNQTNLDIGKQAVLVEAQSGGACGNEVGCPYVILFRTAQGWTPVWSGFAQDKGMLMTTSHGGVRDIALGHARGYSVLKFDGRKYQDKFAQ